MSEKFFLSSVGFSDVKKYFDLPSSQQYSLTNEQDFPPKQSDFGLKNQNMRPSDFQKWDKNFFLLYRVFRRRKLVSYC